MSQRKRVSRRSNLFFFDKPRNKELTYQTFLSFSVLELHITTIPDKIFGTNWSNSVKDDRKRKVWYLFLRTF